MANEATIPPRRMGGNPVATPRGLVRRVRGNARRGISIVLMVNVRFPALVERPGSTALGA